MLDSTLTSSPSSKSACPATDHPETAERQLFSRYGVEVRPTHVGRGVFAGEPLAANHLIAEIPGRVIDDPHYHSPYCIDLGGAYSLEPAPPFLYLNHACEPNCMLAWVEADNEAGAVIELFTLREITPGEELTIDYAWPAEAAIPCACGGPQCRGWIVDVAERDLVDEFEDYESEVADVE